MVTRQNGHTTIPDWQLATIGAVLVLVIGAVGTLVGWQIRDVQAKVAEHDERLSDHNSLLATHSQQLKNIEAQGDKVDSKLTRIDEKIDKLFEEVRRK